MGPGTAAPCSVSRWVVEESEVSHAGGLLAERKPELHLTSRVSFWYKGIYPWKLRWTVQERVNDTGQGRRKWNHRRVRTSRKNRGKATLWPGRHRNTRLPGMADIPHGQTERSHPLHDWGLEVEARGLGVIHITRSAGLLLFCYPFPISVPFQRTGEVFKHWKPALCQYLKRKFHLGKDLKTCNNVFSVSWIQLPLRLGKNEW